MEDLYGKFTDPRVNMLWAVSDTLTLAEVAKRYPEILPPEQWKWIEENQEMCLNGLDHYADSPNHNYEWSEEKTDREWTALTQSLRWRGVLDLVTLMDAAPARLMDFGTHTGAHAVYLSNIFPEAQVFAREIVKDIAPAIEYTIQKYATNPDRVHFDLGDHRSPPLPRDLDLLYAGEVFEHMWEWREFIQTLEDACRPGGRIILTVPNGPWEAGNDRHIHVAHWEVEDLHEVFGAKEGLKTLQISHYLHGAIPSGWVLVTWLAHTGPMGEINMDRKLARWGF